jgi:hypothetical protein
MKVILPTLIFLVATIPAFAGPPFRTDDPEPVGYHRSEGYFFSMGTRKAGGTSGIGPAVEFNYGPLPDMMLHLVAPMAYHSPEHGRSHFGYGDTELGMKYRIVHETGTRPMVGIFPLVEIPTGDRDKDLGNGQAQYFVPIWLQKDFGKWTTYGGGGYWINPGSGNRNYWFFGVLLQYEFSEGCYLGGELFHQTADTADGKDSSGINLGGGLPFVNNFQLLFSAGRGLTNTSRNRFSYYLGLYRAF